MTTGKHDSTDVTYLVIEVREENDEREHVGHQGVLHPHREITSDPRERENICVCAYVCV